MFRSKDERSPVALGNTILLFAIVFGVAWIAIAKEMGLPKGVTFLAVILTIFAAGKVAHNFFIASNNYRLGLSGVQANEESPPGAFCPYCGNEVQDDFDFCPKCGKDI